MPCVLTVGLVCSCALIVLLQSERRLPSTIEYLHHMTQTEQDADQTAIVEIDEARKSEAKWLRRTW